MSNSAAMVVAQKDSGSGSEAMHQPTVDNSIIATASTQTATTGTSSSITTLTKRLPNHQLVNAQSHPRHNNSSSTFNTASENGVVLTSSTPRVSIQQTLAVSTSEVCRYYPRGMCRFGEVCRFAHVLDIDTTASTGDLYDSTHQSHKRPQHKSSAAPSSANMPATVNNLLPQTTTDTTVFASTSSTLTKSGSTAPTLPSFTSSKSVRTPASGVNIVPTDPTSWVLAPVFVPKQQRDASAAAAVCAGISYAQAVGTEGSAGTVTVIDDSGSTQLISAGEQMLCPYRRDAAGQCPYGDRCDYDHGEPCDLCGHYVLSAIDEAQRKHHREECMRQHELDMELSFAIARSKDKTCGVCFEVIMDKSGGEQRFGILPNCNHIFCLQCIRKWRLANQFDKKIIRACPECRVTSDFVCPSAFWVDTKEEKAKLLSDYRRALEAKDCKYFKQGQSKCPFGNKCFYKHALKNGVLVDVGLPPKPVRRQNHLGDVDDLQQFLLWDFMEDRDNQWLEDMARFYAEGDDDDEVEVVARTHGPLPDPWSVFNWERMETLLAEHRARTNVQD